MKISFYTYSNAVYINGTIMQLLGWDMSDALRFDTCQYMGCDAIQISREEKSDKSMLLIKQNKSNTAAALSNTTALFNYLQKAVQSKMFTSTMKRLAIIDKDVLIFRVEE